jgi:RNA polymerase sigma factor (sigma-70 family)
MTPNAVDVVGLVERYMPLAAALARKFTVRFPALADDFASDAAFALFEAARRFRPVPEDPTQTVGFAAFARVVVTRGLLQRLRSERQKHPLTFEGRADLAAVAAVPGDEPAPDAAAEYADDVAQLERLLATLSDRRRELVVRHVAEGETLRGLAAERGVTAGAVFQCVHAAVRRLRRDARKDEN